MSQTGQLPITFPYAVRPAPSPGSTGRSTPGPSPAFLRTSDIPAPDIGLIVSQKRKKTRPEAAEGSESPGSPRRDGRQAESGLGDLVMEAARGLRRRYAAMLEPWGITPHESRALRVIGQHEPTRLGVVAQHLRIAPRSVTDVVDALETRGLVAREPDPSDRRATQVALTTQGRGLLDELDAARRADQEAYFESLSVRDREALARILGRLVEDA